MRRGLDGLEGLVLSCLDAAAALASTVMSLLMRTRSAPSQYLGALVKDSCALGTPTRGRASARLEMKILHRRRWSSLTGSGRPFATGVSEDLEMVRFVAMGLVNLVLRSQLTCLGLRFFKGAGASPEGLGEVDQLCQTGCAPTPYRRFELWLLAILGSS
jgi:hypothetical protein